MLEARHIEMANGAIAREYRKALANYERIHGAYPPPEANLRSFLRDYLHIPTLDELAAKTADLGQRIDAAKAKHPNP